MNSYVYKVTIEANSQEEADAMLFEGKRPAEWNDSFLDFVMNEDGETIWEN